MTTGVQRRKSRGHSWLYSLCMQFHPCTAGSLPCSIHRPQPSIAVNSRSMMGFNLSTRPKSFLGFQELCQRTFVRESAFIVFGSGAVFTAGVAYSMYKSMRRTHRGVHGVTIRGATDNRQLLTCLSCASFGDSQSLERFTSSHGIIAQRSWHVYRVGRVRVR